LNYDELYPLTMRHLYVVIFLALALQTVVPDFTPSLSAADRVRLALPAKSMDYLPLFVAIHRGFQNEAIDIDTLMMLP
jgi:hypothetical protein